MVAGTVNVGWHSDSAGLHYAYLPYLWLGLVLGLTAGVAAAFPVKNPLRQAVAIEWGSTFTPLPVNVAMTCWRITPLIQIASLVGVWGVSWLIYFAGAALARSALDRKRHALPLAAGLLCGALLFGFVRFQASG